MKTRSRGSLLPLTYIFGSFFGAIMIASVFAYNNYRFSKYNFVDFNELIFYEKSEIFIPNDDRYELFIFSSNQPNNYTILNSLQKDHKILAVDLHQKRIKSNNTVNYITSDINTILKLMGIFNVTHIPSSLQIVKQSDGRYKQDSKINKI
ncbi:hypothetical protein [Campylobacter majalis]|uniref:hypothetical protein n=1 Tax=Campylobacter majalis TaxID=2790656 RepID=UPI003D69A5EA